jgi:beta-1,4-mannosyl-glycoprotein beta-1,4-N-acetylglucosaminyltransferase
MIYDCFQFSNELTLLEIRLNHHSSFVDKFVITESPWTYSGIKKRLYFNEVKDKAPFVQFKDKIIHRIFDKPPNGLSNWDYEHQQRNYLRTMDFNGDDLILYMDCDEIIRDKSVIDQASQHDRIITLDMTLCWYYFNCIIAPNSEFQPDYSMERCFNHRWRMGKICRSKHLNWVKNIYQIRQLFLWDLTEDYTIKNSGWHFSNLGDPGLIYKKLCSFSHSKELHQKYDLSKKAIKRRKKRLQDPLGRDVSFIETPLDVPKFITDNIDKYKKYIL